MSWQNLILETVRAIRPTSRVKVLEVRGAKRKEGQQEGQEHRFGEVGIPADPFYLPLSWVERPHSRKVEEGSRGWPAGSGRKARVFTYKRLKPDFVVVSRLDGGKVFYQRTVCHNGGRAQATYLLNYPDGHKEASRIISILNAILAFS